MAEEIKIVLRFRQRRLARSSNRRYCSREIRHWSPRRRKRAGHPGCSEALQDARHGLTLKWSAHARADELKARLDRYTFHHEQVDNSAGKNLA